MVTNAKSATRIPMNNEMIDYHCHLLPAIDDGATEVRESVAMARILARFGFTTVHCTPHLIRGGYENLPERVTHLTGTLQSILDHEGIALRLVPGTEHYMDEFLPMYLQDSLTCGSPGRLLVEAPFLVEAEALQSMLSGIFRRGWSALVAHPERCAAFHLPIRKDGVLGRVVRLLGARQGTDQQETLIGRLRQSGCAFQGNLGSFAGNYGKEVKQQAIELLRQGIYSCIGSDAHRSTNLENTLTIAYRVVAAEIGDTATGDLFSGRMLKDALSPPPQYSLQ